MKMEIVLSLVITVSAAVYTFINLLMLLENKITRKQRITPHLIVYLTASKDHMLHVLKLKSIGEGLIRNARVKFIDDYKQFGGKGSLLSDLGIVKNGFSSPLSMNYST